MERGYEYLTVGVLKKALESIPDETRVIFRSDAGVGYPKESGSIAHVGYVSETGEEVECLSLYAIMNHTRNSYIAHIADFYGFEAQSEQLIEEMAELTVSIKHFKREEKADLQNLLKELADVEFMLEQIKYLLKCCSEVDEIKVKIL